MTLLLRGALEAIPSLSPSPSLSTSPPPLQRHDVLPCFSALCPLQRTVELQRYQELGPEFVNVAKQYGDIRTRIADTREMLQRVKQVTE